MIDPNLQAIVFAFPWVFSVVVVAVWAILWAWVARDHKKFLTDLDASFDAIDERIKRLTEDRDKWKAMAKKDSP